jgi:hypothetical protein
MPFAPLITIVFVVAFMLGCVTYSFCDKKWCEIISYICLGVIFVALMVAAIH